ncbi:type II toxin-antitoxin system VapC family toxin [Aminobacter sp. Piv2-1]|uniref:type II toxin-antitoxin system VapC family toxin n=1 Tax=Aminobacter sp. Piv2-1 TaxID=3031122 RepID=UPI0030957654
MPGSILIDTCAAIWITEGAKLDAKARAELDHSAQARMPVMVSPTSAWEMGMLVARQKVLTAVSAQSWFASLVIPPFSALAPLTAEILINSSFLPGVPPRDPFDRLFIATAREHGYRIMTRDSKILAYAEQGHVQAIPC